MITYSCVYIYFYFISDLSVRYNAYFGVGSGPIFLDNVGCSGIEDKLFKCSYTTDVADDTHFEDAGVECSLTGKTASSIKLVRVAASTYVFFFMGSWSTCICYLHNYIYMYMYVQTLCYCVDTLKRTPL